METGAWNDPNAFGGMTADPFRATSSGWASLIGNGVSDPFKPYDNNYFEQGPVTYDQRMKSGGLSYDPGTHGSEYDPFSSIPMKVINADIDQWLMETYPENFNFDDPTDPATGQPVPGAPVPGYVGGKLTNAGGGYSMLDEANGDIAAAAAKFGVPENLIKAMIMRESTGNWARDNRVASFMRDGQMVNILPYVGMLQTTAAARGFDWNAMIGNRALQIEAMASLVKTLAGTYGGFENAAKVYFGGERALQPGGFTDENNMHSSEYYGKAISDWRYFDSLAGTQPATSGNVAPIASGGMGSIWGNTNANLTQEFGPTDFSRGAGAWMYRYAAAYGAEGHTGVDIGLDVGTQIYAPTGGTVVHAGGTGYFCSPDTDPNGGCGPGMGELRIRLDNGHEVILGHNSSISVKVGQRVTAGQPVAKSGSMNGGHVHVEYRVPDSSLPAGWRILDPRGYLGAVPGYVPGLSTPGGTPSIPGVNAPATGAQGPLSYEQLLRYGAMGKPLPTGNTGGGAASGWNYWLQRAMGLGG